MFFQDSMRFK